MYQAFSDVTHSSSFLSNLRLGGLVLLKSIIEQSIDFAGA